jgi:hypothetical protein
MSAALRHPSVDIPRRPGEPPKSFVEVTERPSPVHGATDGPKQRAAFIRDGLLRPVTPREEVYADFVVTTRYHDDDCWAQRVVARKAQVRVTCLSTCRYGQPMVTCKLLGTEDWRKNPRKDWEQ